ncbi:MAG: iron-containing alcohol dehydrogenase family protein [Thermoproteota archaeon]
MHSKMSTFTFQLLTKIIFGRGSLSKLGEEASKFGKRCLVVSGRNFAKKSGYLSAIEENLKKYDLETFVFDNVEPNPSVETVYKGAMLARQSECDLVIGFGGGSAIDAAKAIAFLRLNDVNLEDHFSPKEIVGQAAPILALPTTCGTGSEVTRYSLLTDLANRRKKVLVGLPILPRTALLDASVLDNIPKQMLAYTGFDALSHSFEALLSKLSNRISDMFAYDSIRAVCSKLSDAYDGDLDSRETVFYGSMLAGIAINSTGTVIVHGMGYYLTNYHDVHHGLANATLLSHVLRFEGDVAARKLERVALSLGLKDVPALLDFVEDLADKVGIPRSIAEFGVREEELDTMVADAMSYSRNIENNPIKVSANDIREIYTKALKGRRAG